VAVSEVEAIESFELTPVAPVFERSSEFPRGRRSAVRVASVSRPTQVALNQKPVSNERPQIALPARSQARNSAATPARTTGTFTTPVTWPSGTNPA